MDMTFYAPGLILAVDEGLPLLGLGGMHGGCYELFGSTRVQSVAELRSRTVAVATSEGKVDAVLGFPPEPQEFRARKIGHALINTTADRPWSQYFCCFATGNRDFVRKHPVATKRALRALVKAVDLCAAEPAKVVRELVDPGFLQDHDYRCKPCARSRTGGGASTTRRTRSGSSPCACTRRG